MALTIKRLHELSKAELTALSIFMCEEIKPRSITEGSDWVCQRLQRPYFWSDEGMAGLAARKPDKNLAWVGFENGSPIAICMVEAEPEALLIALFMVKTAGKAEAEQFAIADVLAIESLEGLPERKVIYGWFPTVGFAPRYAERCGFKSATGKQMAPDSNPLRRWYHSPQKLLETIKGFQRVTPR